MQSQWWKRFWLHRRQGLSVCLSLCLSTSVCLCLYHSDHNAQLHSVSQKSPPPEVMLFFNFFHKRLRIFNRFLHTYYTFVSSIDYRFLFNYIPVARITYTVLVETLNHAQCFHGSGTVCQPGFVSPTTTSENFVGSWSRFCSSDTATHSDYFVLMRLLNTLTHSLTHSINHVQRWRSYAILSATA